MTPIALLASLASAPLQMDLATAVERARDSATAPRLAGERIGLERTLRTETVSRLLPRVDLAASQLSQSANMATFGLSLPNLDPYVPFYSIQDLRASVAAPLFQPVTWRRLAEGEARTASRALERESVRANAALAGGLAWVEAARSQALARDREEALQLARTLLQIAVDQKAAGGATRLDLVRAQAQELQAERSLSQARLARSKALTALARATGAGDTIRLEIRGELPLHPSPGLPPSGRNPSIQVRAAKAAREASALAVRSADAEALPTLAAFADYGYIGTHLQDNGQWTGKVGIQASWHLYEGGGREARLENARIQERMAALQEQEAILEASRDERDAMASVAETGEQLRQAMALSALADTELALSQEKFKAGAAGNAEVVQAQGGRNQAHASWIDAAWAHQSALLRLRFARGNWEGLGRETP